MSGQDGRQVPALQRPTTNDPEAWRAYWQAQGQPWRTEPEIDVKRQEELAQRRAIAPDIEKGIYPFKDMKLSRADVEWLLAEHESGGFRGPVKCEDESREGLDLRGADLSQADLSNLPLIGLRGSLTRDEWTKANPKSRKMAPVLMEETDLRGAQLKSAHLGGAHLQGAYLWKAQLERADLRGAHLQGAELWRAELQGAHLWRARLQGAILSGAQLQDADIRETWLQDAELSKAKLVDVNGIGSGVAPRLADVQWSNTNLAVVDWSQIEMLGDEYEAQQKACDGKAKDKATRLKEYKEAVRANRQLAVALQAQGLNEEAARFAYRAQVLQKSVLWFQMTQQGVAFGQRMQALGAWLFSGVSLSTCRLWISTRA